MPELPEIETITRELRPIITGKIFQNIHIYWDRTITGNSETLRKNLINASILNVKRRGKYIYFILDKHWRLIFHLGMSGKIVVRLGEKDKKYLRVRFDLNEENKLYFIDMRKFGRIRIEPTSVHLMPRLGPEPLKPAKIIKILETLKTKRRIKTLLLDQHILSGIGNIYADEILFRAQIHPATPFDEIKIEKLEQLSKKIPQVLAEAIKNLGTTISDYQLPDLLPGKHQNYLRVYGRVNQPCPECKNSIKRIRISGRSSYFCPKCQFEVNS